MTWYIGDERIGDDTDAANRMLDDAVNQTGNGDEYMEAFEEFMNEAFKPVEVLEMCTKDNVGFDEFFIDWAVGLVKFDDGFADRFGFTWRDE